MFTSDDGGQTWRHRTDFPFMHARPFAAGDALYVLGQADDLTVIRSEDRGKTWSEPARLTEGQFLDPDHLWFHPRGKTFHLWTRANTGGTGYAAVLKVVEQDDGSLVTQLENAPSSKNMLFVPCPGGQMKFHVLYDDVTRKYWLLSTQATDSMARPDRLPPNRYNLPFDQRRRLQLHFSKNMIDWCFAGHLTGIDRVLTASRERLLASGF